MPMLVGNVVSIVSGAIFSVTVTLLTRKSMTQREVEAEWEKTRSIDNPLTPWVQLYKVRETKSDRSTKNLNVVLAR